MGNGIRNSIRQEKGLTAESRKSLSEQVGVKGFEPSTSWSRTKAGHNPKSDTYTQVTAQVDSVPEPEMLWDCADVTPNLPTSYATENRNGIADTAPAGPWHAREYVLADPRPCAACGKIFRPRQRTVERSGGRFC